MLTRNPMLQRLPGIWQMPIVALAFAALAVTMQPAAAATAGGVAAPVTAVRQVSGASVVAGRSEIAFTLSQLGVHFNGRFRKWRADVDFDPAALARSHAVIDVDLASIDFASEDSEDAARGPQWFDTKRFPVAHFASTSIASRGGDRYDVIGLLSLKGITHDCVVPIVVKPDASGNRVAEGSFAIRRLDYRIGEGEWADPATVANDVIVKLRMVLAPPA
jgi:polyisoprenoid-binding protein YceI